MLGCTNPGSGAAAATSSTPSIRRRRFVPTSVISQLTGEPLTVYRWADPSVASRRLQGRWQAQASDVLSKAEGTVDNGYDGGLGPLGIGSQGFTSAAFGLEHVQDRVPSVSVSGYDQPVLFGAPLAIPPPCQATLGARWKSAPSRAPQPSRP